MKAKTESGSIADVTVKDFRNLKPASKPRNFIHARNFDGHIFQKSKLIGSDGKFNKTRYLKQTAELIKKDCNNEEPCLVWLAWNLRSKDIVLKAPAMPTLDTCVLLSEFDVMYACPKNGKRASDYLCSQVWVDMLGSAVNGVSDVHITRKMIDKAGYIIVRTSRRVC